MGLFDEVKKLDAPEQKAPKSEHKPHSHNGKVCKSFGSCATKQFEDNAARKKSMAKRMK